MYERPDGLYWGLVLDAPEAKPLAEFYSAVLGWRIDKIEPGFVTLYPGEGVGYVAVQSSPEYVPPVWPAEAGQQQMMLHIDVEVSDLEAAVDHAVEQGARLAAYQPQEQVRVMLDPVGHPFCLYIDTSG